MDQGYLYNKIMENVEKVIKQTINETFGVKEFGNEQYDKEIYKIADDILKNFEYPIQYDSVLLENGNEICKLKQLKYKIKSIDWLYNLYVYITSFPILSYDNDVITIENQTFVYEKINDEKVKIVPADFSFRIINNDLIVEPYIVKDNKIVQASILISVPNIGIVKNKLYKHDELSAILQHEFSHLYDYLATGKTSKIVNTDLMEQGNYLSLSEEQNDLIKKLLGNNIRAIEKKQIIKEKINSNVLHNLFVDNIYLLNKSEMRARLQNCRYEIKKNIDRCNSIVYNQDIQQNILRQISVQFNTYYILYELFKLLIKYTPNEVKEEFVEKSIKEQFGKLRPDNYEPKYPYNKSFKNNKNEYDLDSFDKFFNYHIDNIYNIFLRNALSIFGQYFQGQYQSPLKFLP